GRRVTSSRWPVPSTPAPTRSSATSSPSACSASRGSRAPVMRFGFSDDQLALRDAVGDLLAKECPPEAVRAAWDSDRGLDPAVWSHLAEMGVLGLLAPDGAGGLGLDEVDFVLILEECGRAALPGPLVEHAAIAIPTLSTATAVAPTRSSAEW